MSNRSAQIRKNQLKNKEVIEQAEKAANALKEIQNSKWDEAMTLNQELNRALAIFLAPAVMIRNENLTEFFPKIGKEKEAIGWINSLAKDSRFFSTSLRDILARHEAMSGSVLEEHFALYIEIMQEYMELASNMESLMQPAMIYLADLVGEAITYRDSVANPQTTTDAETPLEKTDSITEAL